MKANIYTATAAVDLADRADIDAVAVPKTLFDAKGDILIGTADNVPARLPIGLDGQALVARPALANGMAWEAPPSAVTHEVLRSTDLTQTTSTAENALFAQALGAQTNVGRRFRFDLAGEIRNSSGASVTYTMRLRLTSAAGTAIWQSGGLVVATAADNRSMVGHIDVRMVSATVLRSSALINVGAPQALTTAHFGVPLAALTASGAPAAGIAVNWSAGVTVVLTLQMTTSNANATWTLRDLNLTTHTA